MDIPVSLFSVVCLFYLFFFFYLVLFLLLLQCCRSKNTLLLSWAANTNGDSVKSLIKH